MQIHQFADDGQAEIREQQFARNSFGRQDGEAGGTDVLRLLRFNQSRQATVGAHSGGDDVAGLDNPCRAAGRFFAGDDVAGGRAVRREVANLDVVKWLKDVGLAVTRNEVEAAGDVHGLFIEINGEDFFADVVVAALRLFLQGEQVTLREFHVAEDVAPDFEDAVDRKARRAGGDVYHGFVLARVEHLHAHVNDVAGAEILALLALAGFVDEVGLAVFLKQPGFDGLEVGQIKQRKVMVRLAVAEDFGDRGRHGGEISRPLRNWRAFWRPRMGIDWQAPLAFSGGFFFAAKLQPGTSRAPPREGKINSPEPMVSEAMTAPGPKNVSLAIGFLEDQCRGSLFLIARMSIGAHAGRTVRVSLEIRVSSFKREINPHFHFANRRQKWRMRRRTS